VVGPRPALAAATGWRDRLTPVGVGERLADRVAGVRAGTDWDRLHQEETLGSATSGSSEGPDAGRPGVLRRRRATPQSGSTR
jgi:hypothetical protein